MSDCIVQVVTQREAGGAQSVALLLHRELRARGLNSELWFLFARTQAYAAEPGTISLWPQRPRPAEIPAFLSTLIQHIRRANPRAMIAHTHYANVLALPAARFCGVGKRLAVHHNDIQTYPVPAQYLERLSKRLGMHTMSITVSELVRQSLVQWDETYRSSAHCIYNGLAPADNVSSSNLFAESPSCLLGKKVLLTVGRLTGQKNQQALVHALAELPDCVAVIAGHGPLAQHLNDLAVQLGVETRLQLLGELDPQTVAHWMRRADVFVFPSTFEAMPMALLEAMRTGMAIVASDIPAHRELAVDSVLFSDTAPSTLAENIQKALRQKTAGNALGDAARERALRFTATAMADAYLEAL